METPATGWRGWERKSGDMNSPGFLLLNHGQGRVVGQRKLWNWVSLNVEMFKPCLDQPFCQGSPAGRSCCPQPNSALLKKPQAAGGR